MASVVGGSHNTAIGEASLNQLTSGTYNTALGYVALGNGTVTGDHNTAVGNHSMWNVSGGSANTAIGNESGVTLTTGTNNTLVGDNSDVSGVAAINQIAIGANAATIADNTTQIGDANMTTMKIGGVAGAIETGNTTNTTAVPWMLGNLVTALTTADTSQYLEIMVNGAIVKLVVAV